MAELRKYGSTDPIYFVLLDPTTGDLMDSATFAAGDWRTMKDGGTWANVTNLPVDEGEGWYSWTPVAAEMEGKVIVLKGWDLTSPQDWAHNSKEIHTGGHASALWNG